MIYESPDGGNTIYSRSGGSNTKNLVYKSPTAVLVDRWYTWREILRASQESPSLANAVKQAELIYALIKDKKI